METIKEDGEDEDADLEADTLISHKNSDLGLKPFEELKPAGLTRKATFPRNFSTMSFMGNKNKRRTSKESIISSYSRLDFTGSSIHLHIDVSNQCLLALILQLLKRRRFKYKYITRLSLNTTRKQI